MSQDPHTGEPPEDRRPRSAPENGSLPVEALPPDAPTRPLAAIDQTASRPDPDEVAHDPHAERSPRLVMQAYAQALGDGDAAAATELYAEHATVLVESGQLTGRAQIRRWHQEMLDAGPVDAELVAQGNDTGRLNLHGSDGGVAVVELAFDASGRIGTARWLPPDTAVARQEDRTTGNR